MSDDVALELRFILPIPHEFDDMPEDIMPIEGGWFRCMMCFAKIARDWRQIEHDEFCVYAHGYEGFPTHGQVRPKNS